MAAEEVHSLRPGRVRAVMAALVALPALAGLAGSGAARAAHADHCSALAGTQVAAALISLPTRGAVIDQATPVATDRAGAAVPYCAVHGRIAPVDPAAPAIEFQLNLPEQWNGKALQFGGGGYNGRIPDATGWSSHDLRTGPTALARGYLTFSDDSGHQAPNANDGQFAENDEALANFGALHIRKTRDVMVEIARIRYGRGPHRLYYAGGSTGGREAMTAALRWPDAYDGVIANYPTANFLGVRLQNAALSHAIYADGGAGWIAPELVRRIAAEGLAACDALDGLADGIVSNMAACRAGAAERLRKFSCTDSPPPCLTPAQQQATIAVYHDGFSDTWQPRDSTNGYRGYNILEGVAMDLGSQPDYKPPLVEGPNAHAALRADEFLKHFVARDPGFDLRGFDVQAPGALAARLLRIPELIGATSPDFGPFARRGGKLLLLQGDDDVLVSPHENIRRYEAIVAAMGEGAVRQFLRFYLVPGQGHGVGTFQATWDNVDVLDAWVERKQAPPESPVAFDANPKTAGRSRPLCEYPKWPKYRGQGNPDLAASFSCVAEPARPEVRVAEGIVRGQLRDGVAEFRAIPYAAPPVGALRFRPPQPAKAWQGVREATDEGPSCPQPQTGDPAGKASTNEDCLYLGVFAPAAFAAGKRPVMVWIHGGGWAEGFSGARQYDPAPLVKEGGIVVVSINYRLGTLGLLATPGLDMADGEPSGNQLIRDQQAALRWVQKNIGAFGGDPAQVTIAGESAGANSALALVASPLSRGLFRGAIVQSGVDDAHTLGRARAEQVGDEVAEALGCKAGAGQAECLRALPVEAILKVRRKLGIVADPKLFPLDPYVALHEGRFNRVPMIIGTALHEGYLFASGAERSLGHAMTVAEYESQMKTTFGAAAEAVMKAYPAAAAPSPAAAVGDAMTDVRFACYMDLARVDAAPRAAIFGYEMNEPDPAQQQPRPKVTLANTSYHTSDLGYLFDFDSAPLTGAAAELGRKWRAWWIQFVKTGAPNGPGLPEWPRFTGATGQVLNLSGRGGTTTDFAVRHRCGELLRSGLVSRNWQ